MAGRTHAAAPVGYREEDLVKWGYSKHTNTLGVVYYVNPNDPENDWIANTDGPYWHTVPWHLVENPYVNPVDPGPTREVETGRQGREMTAAALGERIAAIYGEVLVGPDVFFQKVINNVFYRGSGLGHGELDSVQHMYGTFQGIQKFDFATAGGFWNWEFKPGTTTQTTSAILAPARSGSTAFIHPGLGYVAEAWVFDSQGMPDVPDPKFLVRGRKCYDPRLDASLASTGTPTLNATTVVWARNDALILADYLVNDWFGLGLGYNGLIWQSIIDAANYCDVFVGTTSVTDVTITYGGNYAPGVVPTVTFPAPGGGGTTATGTAIMTQNSFGVWIVGAVTITNPGSGYGAPPVPTFTAGAGGTATATSTLGEARHRMDIALRRATTHKNNIETLRQHFRCSFTEQAGRLAFVIDTAKASSYTFTKDNARAISGSSRGTSKVPTASVLTFTNPKKDWVQDQHYVFTVNAQNGVDEYRQSEWILEGITRANEAARQNSYLLGKQRANLGVVVELITTDGHQLQRGDRVTVIFDILAMPGGVDFTIDTIKDNGNGRFLCDVSYYNPAIFADTVGVVESHIDLAGVDPNADLAPPTGLNFTYDGSRVVVGFTPISSPFYGGNQLLYSVSGGPVVEYGTVFGSVPLGPFGSKPLPVTVWIRTINTVTGKPGATALTGTSMSVASNMAKVLTVISDRQTVSYDGNNQIIPASQTTTFTAVKQNISTVVQWTITRMDGTVLNPALYLSATTGDSVTMTAANFEAARGTTQGVIVTPYAVEIV